MINEKEYIHFLRKTREPIPAYKDFEKDKIERVLGLVGKASEVSELYKKWFQNGTYAKGRLVEELGDVFYYLMAIIDMEGFTLEQVVNANIAKLKERYKL